MLLPLAVANLLATSSSFQIVESRFDEDGPVFVRLGGPTGSHWLLVDSGSDVTFGKWSRSVERVGFDYAPGIRIEFTVKPTSPNYSWSDLDAVGVDGVLGADSLGSLGCFIDYRNKALYLRLGRPPNSDDLPSMLAKRNSRATGLVSLPLRQDASRYRWRTALSVGAGSAAPWIVDSGANAAFVPKGTGGLGESIQEVVTSTSTSKRSDSIHLAPLRLPGARPVPLLVLQRPDASDEPVIGIAELSDDWVLWDAPRGRICFPPPTALGFAKRVAAALQGDPPCASAAQLAILAKVDDPGSLARARALATKLSK